MKRETNNRYYSRKTLFTAILLITLMLFSACGSKDGDTSGKSGGLFKKEESPVNLKILCVGDIIAHGTNIQSAYDLASGTYDFTDNYDYVKSYIEEADLALCNMETTFGGGKPTGYPAFNAPDELAANVASVGFDVAITSNNHMMDTGFNGMQRTISVLRDAGFATVGSRLAGEERYIVKEVNGVKIGVVAYTYETSAAAGAKVSINGNPVSAEGQELINTFNYHELESGDYDKIQQDIDGAKEDGAEIIVCYFHWGEEYMREPTSYQLDMAQKVSDMGADMIFASHPHLLQGADVITSADGRSVPVFYSMGNFISNQREETLPSISNRKYTEQGMMAVVDVEYMKGTGEILSEKMTVIPTWVDKYGSNVKYSIIPLNSDLDNNETLKASGHTQRAASAFEDVKKIFGEEYLEGKTILMGEDADEGSNKAA